MCLHSVKNLAIHESEVVPLQQVSNAIKAGALAVLIANNGTTGFFRMQPDSSSGGITVPSASLPLSTARPLWNGLTAGMTLNAQFLTYKLPTGDCLSMHALPWTHHRCSTLFLLESRCVRKQAARKRCRISYPLKDSPDPSSTQSTVTTVLSNHNAPPPAGTIGL